MSLEQHRSIVYIVFKMSMSISHFLPDRATLMHQNSRQTSGIALMREVEDPYSVASVNRTNDVRLFDDESSQAARRLAKRESCL